MKKIESNRVFEGIEGILLFRDDLEDIIERMRLHSLEPKIEDPSSLYDTLDELQRLKGNKPSKVSISATTHNPYTDIEVTVEKNGHAWISANGSSELRSFAYELKDFLTKNVHWYHKFLNSWIWTGIVYGSLVALQGANKHEWLAQLFVVLLFVSLLLLGLSLVFNQLSYGIRLTRRHEGGFFTRNRDQILLVLLGSAIGAIATVLLQLFLRK